MVGERNELFFHFTTAEAAFEFILPDRRLRLSPHSVLRDPLENKEIELGDFAGGYYPGAVSDQVAFESLAKATETLRSIKKRAKILALTVDPPGYEAGGREVLFGRGYASARMWEHYAENHAGVCLAFDRAKLDAELRDQLSRYHPIAGMSGNLFDGAVEYTTTGWAGAASARGFALSPEIAEPEKAARHFEAHIHEILFLKTKDWETEYEYRYAAFTPGEGFDYIQFGESLKAVIVGERFPAWQAAGAIEVCKAIGVDAKQLTYLKEGPYVEELVPWADMTGLQRDRAQRAREAGRVRLPS